jgi:hypothetical protein
VSGRGITRFDREFTVDDLKPFQQFRPKRVLILTPPASMERARQLWTTFKGSTSGDTGVSRGKVSGGDLPALFLLKTILDLHVIQSGWWREVSLRIDADAGSDLQIHASDEKRVQVLNWIRSIAGATLPAAYFEWAREAAGHRFRDGIPDLQALTWERDPQGAVSNPDSVSAIHLQDVARIYF